MNYTRPQYQIALTQLVGFGPIRTKQLLALVSSEEEIFKLSYKKLSELTGIKTATLKSLKREEALVRAVEISENLDKFGIDTIYYSDSRYPRRLKQCDDSPLILYTRGTLDLNDTKFVAVVGTRDATEYGKKLCADLIQSLSGSNVVVVSGMAYGIDITVHQLCLQHNLKTIGVMAHGLEITYPHLHRGVAKRVIENGCLISEYPPYTRPDKEHFPMRNRIVAGMCDATIVVESKIKGGSLITAELANDYSRDVFAYPGNVFDENSQGCNALIANSKAHLITSGVDFISKMGWNLHVKQQVQRSIFLELTDEEKRVVAVLEKAGQMNIDSIAMELDFPSSKLSVILFNLEMNGLVTSMPGNRCQLV